MPSCRSEASLLISALLEHIEGQSGFLASPEDCDVFRQWSQRKRAPAKKPEPPPPEPAPVVAAPPPPLKETPVKAKKEKPAIEQKSQEEPKAPEPLPILEDAFMDLRKIWMKLYSQIPLLDSLPNDEVAKKIAARWKVKNAVAEISILSYGEPPAQKALLEEIGKAIHTLIRPTQIVMAEPIEKDKQWEAFLSASHLKYTIACDYTLWQLGGLMQYYRENPSQGTRHLGSVPLFLLPDLSLYLKDPLLKRSLWKALCQTLCS